MSFPLDPVVLRRAAAALAARPGEYGDLFCESAIQAEVRRGAGGAGPVVLGGWCGAAARVLGAGGVRHRAVAGLDPDRVARLPALLRDDPRDGTAAAEIPPAGPGAAAAATFDAGAVEGLARYLASVEEALAPGLSPAAGVAFTARGSIRRQEVVVATSEGDLVEDGRDWTSFTWRLSIVGRGGRTLAAAAGGGARDVQRLGAIHPPEEVARRLLRRIEEAGAAAPAPAGAMPVILGPGIGGLLFHEACGHALEGDRALRGRSALADLLGETVGPETLTLVDDPTLDGLPGSRKFDDEGWATSPSILIDQGRVAGLLLDRATARIAGTAPTGSARRESFREPPLPRMTNTFVREGRHDPEEILRAVPRGFYVAEIGAGRADTASADFSFRVRRGYLVSGGRLVAPAGPCTIQGNGIEALAGVRMIGQDLRFDPGSGECGKDGQKARAAVGQPTLLVDGLVLLAEES